MSPSLRRIRPAVAARVGEGERYRILFVSSSGGHLAQLVELRPWWSNQERTWVCPDTTDVRSMLAGETVVAGHHPTTRHVPNLMRNAWLALRTLRRVRPDVVVSDGAGLAVPFFWWAWFLGVRTAYLEVYDRLDGPTLTTRLVRPVTDLMLVQWPRQRDAIPGSVLAGPVY
ncbi:MAG: UDP-N-acetylglucosamine--LPS N-acetylglucosamine transferase [Actinomycetes bacterium]